MTLPQDYAGGLNPGGQAGKHFSMLVDRSDPNFIYLGGDSTPEADDEEDGKYYARIFVGIRTRPADQQWERIAGIDLEDNNYDDVQSPHPDSRDMQWDAGGALLQADDGGLYRRRIEDDEYVWESVNGNIQITEVLSAVYDSNHNTVTIGTQDNGSASQDDEGDLEWEAFGGGDGGFVATEVRSDALSTYNATYFSSQNLSNFTVRRIRDGAPYSTRLLNLQVSGAGKNLYDYEGGKDKLPFTTP
jgi:hypothetical protein